MESVKLVLGRRERCKDSFVAVVVLGARPTTSPQYDLFQEDVEDRLRGCGPVEERDDPVQLFRG